MPEKFDQPGHGGQVPESHDGVPGPVSKAIAQTVFGLVERDESGSYQGRIIGFEHIFFTGSSVAVVEQKLRAHVAELTASGTLVLETEFDSVVPIGTRMLP